MHQTTYGKPPITKTMRKSMSPRRVDLRGMRAPSADLKRLDIIRASRHRPGTPSQTVGDPGTSLNIQNFSSFSETGLFDASVIHVRQANCPMDKSRIMAEIRKNRKRMKEEREAEHERVAKELALLASAPKALFKPPHIQIASPVGYVPLESPAAVLPQRAATPDGLPARPASRHTTVRVSQGRLPMSRPSTAMSNHSQQLTLSQLAAGNTPGHSPLPGQKPPLSRPASAFSAVSVLTAGNKSLATSSEFRPLSANPISPQQSIMRQGTEVRLNEMLRSGTPQPGSQRPSSTNSEMRPLRSFVS